MERIELLGNYNRHDSKLSAQAIEGNLAIHGKQGAAVSAVTFQFRIEAGTKPDHAQSDPGHRIFPGRQADQIRAPNEDVLRVILAADPDTQDYLWTVALTIGRMSEVNNLTWQDVNFKECYLVLYTRKKKGGHRTPRKIPMTDKLFEVLSRRYAKRDKSIPWVFWHRYWSRKVDGWTVGPFKERKKIMRTLCDRAGVRYFRYHAFRHFGASLLEQPNVPIGSIQRILGHEHRSTTELYLHSIGESERYAMDVFNERFESFSHTDSHTDEKGDMTRSS
jgi:integrase